MRGGGKTPLVATPSPPLPLTPHMNSPYGPRGKPNINADPSNLDAGGAQKCKISRFLWNFHKKVKFPNIFAFYKKKSEIFRNSYFLRIRRLILRPRAKRYYIKRIFNHFWYFFARTHFFRKKTKKCSKDHFFAKISTFSLRKLKRANFWSFWALGGKSCEDSKRSIVSKQKR